jgi:hypothetical protein
MLNSGQMQAAQNVKKRYEKQWLNIKGVISVGIGRVNNRAGIIIVVNKNIYHEKILIPSVVEDVPVEIQYSGELKAL